MVINYISLHILIALLDKPLHGYGIKKIVANNSDGSIDLGAGTLYGALKRMVEQGLIIIKDDENDERRKYYQLTEKGKSQLSIELEQVEQTAKLVKKARQKLAFA